MARQEASSLHSHGRLKQDHFLGYTEVLGYFPYFCKTRLHGLLGIHEESAGEILSLPARIDRRSSCGLVSTGGCRGAAAYDLWRGLLPSAASEDRAARLRR